MKRVLSMIFAVLLVVSLAACGADGSDTSTTTDPSSSVSSVSSSTTQPSSSTTQPSSSATTTPSTQPHQHSYQSSVTKQPDCENPGVKTFNCDCGDSYTETIKANGHKWGQWFQTKDPTDKEVGKKQRKCGTCNVYEYQDVSVLSIEEYLKIYGKDMISVFAFHIYPLEFESVESLPSLYIRETIYQKLRWDGKYTSYEKVLEGDDYPTTFYVYKLEDLIAQTNIYFDMSVDWTALNYTDIMDYEVYDADEQSVTKRFPGGAGSDTTYEVKDVMDMEDGTYSLFVDILSYDYETGSEEVSGALELIVRKTQYGYAAVSISQYE